MIVPKAVWQFREKCLKIQVRKIREINKLKENNRELNSDDEVDIFGSLEFFIDATLNY